MEVEIELDYPQNQINLIEETKTETTLSPNFQNPHIPKLNLNLNTQTKNIIDSERIVISKPASQSHKRK
jgi:hypothetical protein